MKFFKNGCKGGGWGIFTRNGGGSQEWGIAFIMWGWLIFKVYLHSWQKGANPLILWRTSPPTPNIAYLLPFSNFVHPPPSPAPTSLSPSNITSTVLSVVMNLWLNEWSCHIWCAILLKDNMDLYMSKRWYLCTRKTLMCIWQQKE